MADWQTISSLATAGGTLVLAVATFASVRSANASAKMAERSLLAGLRPVLMPSRLGDPPEKIGFSDSHWISVDGGHGHAEVTDSNIYLAMAVRNAGSGIAVLHGWRFYPDRMMGTRDRPDLRSFTMLSRDIYVPAGDLGFWQGAFRDPADPSFEKAAAAIKSRNGIAIDVLYGDHEGGQRTISRFSLTPVGEDSWLTAVSRHWNIDRDDPR